MTNFQFDFTLEKFSKIIHNSNTTGWYDSVVSTLPGYHIDTKLRVAAWLAQIGHESNNFAWLTENLNYTAGQLLSVFPSYFSDEDTANEYAHQPEKIANLVYSNRLGNGNEESGDGWKFRGRGAIQVTGKENYSKCSQALYGDLTLLTTPEILIETDGAVRSACWFWNTRGLNGLADFADMVEITRRINGGENGLQDRMARYNLAMSIL